MWVAQKGWLSLLPVAEMNMLFFLVGFEGNYHCWTLILVLGAKRQMEVWSPSKTVPNKIQISLTHAARMAMNLYGTCHQK